ncbi:cytochrome P450 [Tsukamurella soli]|uniref:Cytochrome P450 n=1 Tax=Tsukamurella soli TaxID=644556 RepID=A0ABP8J1W9_9ACTN
MYGPRWNSLTAALKLSRDPKQMARELRAEFGDVSFISVLGRKVVVALGPEAAEQLTRNRDRTFATGPVYDFAFGSFFRRGMILLDADEHRSHRRIMQHAFTTARLATYTDQLQPVIADSIDALPDGPVDMRAAFKALTLDVALRVFVGVTLPRAEADEINKACVDMIEAAGAVVRAPIPGTRWQRGLHGRKRVERFFRELLPGKRATPGPDLFSALCAAEDEHGAVFTDDDVINHMIFILFASHDTATVALTEAAYQLAESPEWQEKSRAEALAAPAALAYDGLADLPLLDMVVREALRIRPPVPVIPRAAVADTHMVGHFVPKGTFVVTLTEANHHLPDVWQDPDTFDPLRFSPEREAPAHRMAWMPYGGGVHHCIGMMFARMEVLTALHHLLRAVEWSAEPGHTMHDRGLTAHAGFTAVVRRRTPDECCGAVQSLVGDEP